MIRGSDGLDYEDLAARLVGEPAKTSRNSVLVGTFGDEFKAAYRETYDYHEEQGHTSLDCHRAAFTQACITAADRAHDDWIAALAHTQRLVTDRVGLGVVTYDPSVLF